MYVRFVKRWIDIVLSLAGIVVLAIPIVVIGIMIKLDSPGPVFFRQKWVGRHKTRFYILKFRSMSTNAPADMPTHRLENPEVYLTSWQSVMRRTSMDELPQFFNILRGSMTVVGLRPALWNQYDLIGERDKYGVNEVTPGLTGWGQINGRDEWKRKEKVRFDGEYVANIGFQMDCKCFFGTIGSVLRRGGVVEGGTGAIAGKGGEKHAGRGWAWLCWLTDCRCICPEGGTGHLV